MLGAGGIGIVFGWVITMMATAGPTTAAARLRLAASILSCLAALIAISYFYQDWLGVVIAVTGGAVGALLATMSRAAWSNGRKKWK